LLGQPGELSGLPCDRHDFGRPHPFDQVLDRASPQVAARTRDADHHGLVSLDLWRCKHGLDLAAERGVRLGPAGSVRAEPRRPGPSGRSRGSRASRRPAPTRLNPRTDGMIAAPGKKNTHQAPLVKYLYESASIAPRSGVGGWAPKPRNPSAAASRIANAMARV